VALNKSNTSIWVKVLIIILILAFVSLFMYQGFAGLFALFQSNPTTASSTTAADPIATLQNKYQPQADALKQVIQSDPASYTAQVQLANLYFDWAQTLSTPVAGQSQLTTPAMMAAYTEWNSAKTAYDAATKVAKTFDAAVQTDRSYASFYSNDATGAIEIAKTVTQKAPTFSQGWAHLGIYLEATGDTKGAIAAYQRYMVIDPKGQNAQYVTARLKALGSAAPSSTTATKTP
jgi:tetratricopeptide (TPR) repeat protein